MSVFGFDFEDVFIHFFGSFGSHLVGWKTRIFDLAHVFDRLELKQDNDGEGVILMQPLYSIQRYVEDTMQPFFSNVLDGGPGDAFKVSTLTAVFDEDVVLQVLLHIRLWEAHQLRHDAEKFAREFLNQFVNDAVR